MKAPTGLRPLAWSPGRNSSRPARSSERVPFPRPLSWRTQQPDALRKQQRGVLAPFGLRIIRAMQPSAARGKTAECVAKQSRRAGAADEPYVAQALVSSGAGPEAKATAGEMRAFRAFRDRRRWRDDARAKTKAGLDQGRDQGWVLLLHASVSSRVRAAAALTDHQPRDRSLSQRCFWARCDRRRVA